MLKVFLINLVVLIFVIPTSGVITWFILSSFFQKSVLFNKMLCRLTDEKWNSEKGAYKPSDASQEKYFKLVIGTGFIISLMFFYQLYINMIGCFILGESELSLLIM